MTRHMFSFLEPTIHQHGTFRSALLADLHATRSSERVRILHKGGDGPARAAGTWSTLSLPSAPQGPSLAAADAGA